MLIICTYTFTNLFYREMLASLSGRFTIDIISVLTDVPDADNEMKVSCSGGD